MGLPGIFCQSCGQGSIAWTCPTCSNGQRLFLAFHYDASRVQIAKEVGFFGSIFGGSKKNQPLRPVFSLGRYKLCANVRDLPGLEEFSSQDYANTPLTFRGEKIYIGDELSFLTHRWGLLVAAVNGEVYKIALAWIIRNPSEARDVVDAATNYCNQQLGNPSEKSRGLTMWNAMDGNVILQVAENMGMPSISIFATSARAGVFQRL